MPLISAANAPDNPLMWLFTLAYSSAYDWLGPFWILTIILGFMGIAHERAKEKPCPVSSWGVEKSRRSAIPQRTILCASIHSVSQEETEVEGRDNSYLHILNY
jgi:hypothetical protein